MFNDIESSALKHVVQACCTNLCTLTVIYSANFMFERRRYRKIFAINFLCMLVTSFPTVLSRGGAAVMYGALIIQLFRKNRHSRLFITLFILAFMFIFPFMNAFRYAAFSSVNITDAFANTMLNISNVWIAGDYDAYTTLCMTIEYVSEHGLTVGIQLAGALLFWIPRTLWPGKPIGSGHMIAQSRGFTFTNISCPLPGECYINFGVAGVIVLGFILGVVARKLDSRYWKGNNVDFDVLYSIIMIIAFILSRGDAMQYIASITSYVVIWKIMQVRIL